MKTSLGMWTVAAGLVLAGATAALDGCSATGNGGHLGEGASAAGGPGGSGAAAGFDPGLGGTGGEGAGVIVNPCASGCVADEICNNGLDDNCNGTVDEQCPCSSGLAESCFKGDPSYAASPGCFPGTQHCTENGNWGDCIGGVHAVSPDNCAVASQAGCHPITSVPFATVNLHDGIGNFGDAAVSESWTVACPPNVSPCPGVGGSNPADDFQPLQSGEYTVTYHLTTASGSDQCSYPLFVGAPGLRVELQWEHLSGQTDSVDLDLHLHRPGSSTPWGGSSGNDDDCGYNNCVASNYIGASSGVEWFNGPPPAPSPWSWSPLPFTPENTTCYHAPRGVGAQWQSWGQGCHNPRLDLDNITCTPSVSNVDDSEFCAPENINVDYPPFEEWMRIGAYYYLDWGFASAPVHPTVKIYCNGRLAGDFGSNYAQPVTFTNADSSSKYWLVADVKFIDDACDPSACTVVPLFGDPGSTTPYLSTASTLSGSFGPPYPP